MARAVRHNEIRGAPWQGGTHRRPPDVNKDMYEHSILTFARLENVIRHAPFLESAQHMKIPPARMGVLELEVAADENPSTEVATRTEENMRRIAAHNSSKVKWHLSQIT